MIASTLSSSFADSVFRPALLAQGSAFFTRVLPVVGICWLPVFAVLVGVCDPLRKTVVSSDHVASRCVAGQFDSYALYEGQPECDCASQGDGRSSGFKH